MTILPSTPRSVRRIFEPGPKRALTIDGGGVRGIVALAFLEEMETALRSAANDDSVVLADYFDLVAGTSVGSMIATMIALGYDVKSIERRFRTLVKDAFSGSWSPIGVKRYDSKVIGRIIEDVVGERTLGSPDLKCGLVIVAKRADTGSPWVLSNNPDMPYYNEGASWPANRNFPLKQIVRASTAAPFMFAPERIQVYRDAQNNEEEGVFVDGGVSPHNNPALQVFLMAGLRAYRMGPLAPRGASLERTGWSLSPDMFQLISVGTGVHRSEVRRQPSLAVRFLPEFIKRQLPVRVLLNDIRDARYASAVLQSVITDCSLLSIKQLQSLSQPRFSWIINSEVGDLANESLLSNVPAIGGNSLLNFQRFDLPLDGRRQVDEKYDLTQEEREQFGLVRDGGRNLPEYTQLQKLDDPRSIGRLHRMAKLVAERQVSQEDFAPYL